MFNSACYTGAQREICVKLFPFRSPLSLASEGIAVFLTAHQPATPADPELDDTILYSKRILQATSPETTKY